MEFTIRIKIFFAAVLVGFALHSGSVHAQADTVYYNNISPSSISPAPVYSTGGTREWADDVPFAGSHVVSAFTFGYKSSYETDPPFKATFRFYGVDPVTGLLGALVAEISRDLPAGEHPAVTIQLDPSEQFVFTSEPGLYYSGASGGWFSMQYEAIGTDNIPTPLYNRHAQGSSSAIMYNVTDQKVVSTLDPNGFIPRSFYLQLFEGSGTTMATDVSITINDNPSSVQINEPLTYRLVVTNIGAEATGVTLTDTLPADITFESVVTSQGTCTPTTVTKTRGNKTTVTTTDVGCALGNLADGASANVDIVIRSNVAGTLTNSASVSLTEDDLNPNNNNVSQSTLVQDPDGGVKPCRGNKCK